MPIAPKDDAVGRAWSWALTKAGRTSARGPVAGGPPSATEVITPLSCRSTAFSSRPRSGPLNRRWAVTSVTMTAGLPRNDPLGVNPALHQNALGVVVPDIHLHDMAAM